MASNPHPPQLELSLGHPGFKRSFQQFGLDVDDGDDLDATSTSSSNSSSAPSSAASSSSATGPGPNGSGSSSRTSTSSQASYGGHSGHAANKRARSEGPETSNDPSTNVAALSQSQGSFSSSSSGLSYTTAASALGDDDAEDRRRGTSSPHSQPADIHAASSTFLPGLRRPSIHASTFASSDTPPSLGPLPFVFEPPPTPSIADFAAARSSASGSGQDVRSIANTQPRVPGFSGMRSPRSSSPAPPPMLDVDVPMRESIEEDEDLWPFTLPQSRRNTEVSPPRDSQAYVLAHDGNPVWRLRQSEGAAASGSSDGLSIASERLRSAMARARMFHHTLAPLRVETDLEMSAASAATSRRQGETLHEVQPRLPPFEFEVPRASSNESESGSGHASPPIPSAISAHGPMSDRHPVRLSGTNSRPIPLPRPTAVASLEDYPRFEPDSPVIPSPTLNLDRDPFTDLSAARASRARESHPTPPWLQSRNQQSFRHDDSLANTLLDGPMGSNSSTQPLRSRLASLDNSSARTQNSAATRGRDAGNLGRNQTPSFSALISARMRDLERASDRAERTISNMTARGTDEDRRRRGASVAARVANQSADLMDMHRRVDQLFRRVGNVRRDTDNLEAQTAQLRRRTDEVRRRTSHLEANSRSLNDDLPEVVDFDVLSTTPFETAFEGAARPTGSSYGGLDLELEQLPDVFSGDTQMREERTDSLGVTWDRYLAGVPARPPSTSQERRHLPASSAGAQTRSSQTEPQQSSVLSAESDRPQAISNSYESGSAVDLSLEASLRRRYPFLDEESTIGSHTTGTGREYGGFSSGSMPSFLDRIRNARPLRASGSPSSGGNTLTDIFEMRRVRLQREASMQRQRRNSHSPQLSGRAPTLSLDDLSFDSNFVSTFGVPTLDTASASHAPAANASSQALSQHQQRRPSRRTPPSSIFIPPPPSAPNSSDLQLPSLRSSVFETLALLSPSLSEFGTSDEEVAASRSRPAPVPAGSSSAFVSRSQRPRSDETDIANRWSWLQPERNDSSAAMEVEGQGSASSIRPTQPSHNEVWSLMDDEEILSPRDGLFSSVTLNATPANENRNNEESGPRARNGTEGLIRSLAEFDTFRQQREGLGRVSDAIDRNREREASRQAAESGNTRFTGLRQLQESFPRSMFEGRVGRDNVHSARPRRFLAAVDSLTGDYPSWMQDAADWQTNLDRTSGSAISRTNASGSSSTSTEAAAFFATGPTIGGDRRPSPELLRQRRLRLSGLGDLSLSQDSDMLGQLDSESPRRSPSLNRGQGASNELESVLFPSRTIQTSETRIRNGQQIQEDTTASDSLMPVDSSYAGERHSSNEANLVSSSPTSRQQVQPNQHQRQPGSARAQSQITTHPPVLPPIGAVLSPDYEAIYERFRSQRPSNSNPDPLSAAQASFGDVNSNPSTNPGYGRGGDMAVHRALMLRSVQNRGTAPERVDEVLRNAEAIATRAGGSIDQTLEVLGADGNGPQPRRRQVFQQAQERARVEREREQERERERERRRSARPEPHVRWGEVHDDPEVHGRPPAYRPIRNRTRRNSLSALFAPPPPETSSATSLAGRLGVPPPGGNSEVGSSLNIGGRADRHSHNHDELLSLLNPTQRARNVRPMNMAQRLRESRDETSTISRSFFRRARARAGLDSFGDFIRDEDFDASYESLIALAASLGDAKPRATPTDVLEALPNGLYKDWQTPGCDSRCPICLDDYKDVDTLLKAEPCNHWCHKDCFEQWLHTANTCPVCRTKITSQRASSSSRPSQPVAGPSGTRRDTPSRRTPSSLIDRFNPPTATSTINLLASATAASALTAATTSASTSTTRSRAAATGRMEPRPLRLDHRIPPFGNANTGTSTSEEGSNSGTSSGTNSSTVSLSGRAEGERDGNDSDSGSDFYMDATNFTQTMFTGTWSFDLNRNEGFRSFRFRTEEEGEEDESEM